MRVLIRRSIGGRRAFLFAAGALVAGVALIGSVALVLPVNVPAQAAGGGGAAGGGLVVRTVHVGDTIAVLDQGPLPAALLQAQAELLSAQAQLSTIQAGADN